MKKLYDIKANLARFVPEKALDEVVHLLCAYPIHLGLKAPRRGVYGDYRSPAPGTSLHKITVNGDMNPYAFLITFIHEYAHLLTAVHYPKSKAHGPEWKRTYKQLAYPFIEKGIFPEDIKQALILYFRTTPSSTAKDHNLMRVLFKYEKKKANEYLLEQLPENAHFVYDKHIFEKGCKNKEKYTCKRLPEKTIYIFSPTTRVFLYTQTDSFH